MENMTVVILAAGLGTRMKTDIPKALHPLSSGTIMGKIVSNLKNAGATDMVAVVGYKADQVEERFKGEMRFVRQKELLGSGDALAAALKSVPEDRGDVLVTCGDTPLITDTTYKFLVKSHLGEEASCTLLTCRTSDPYSYGRIVRDDSGKVLKIVEEKDASEDEKKITEINVGTYCFRVSDLKEYIRGIEMNQKKKEFYLTDIVDILTKNGKRIVTHSCDPEEAIGVNSRKDLAEANKAVNRRTLEKLMDSGVTIMDPETTYIDDSVAIGKDTVIFPCTVIENDVVIAGRCKIGPFARLRPGTKLSEGVEVGNYAELCRTEVGKNTKIKHQSYLGDTVVGSGVNIGAGVITANYDGKNKHRTVIEDAAFIGVGVMLVAPVKIGKGAVVGAGSVVTKNKDVPPGVTVIGIPARPLVSSKK